VRITIREPKLEGKGHRSRSSRLGPNGLRPYRDAMGPHDRTSGVPVTNFRRSYALYATAMKFNKGLDRDNDKAACERR
jgi:hypothetical protein